MKVHELAKELSLPSKDLVALAKKEGIQVKSHLSKLEDADAVKLRKKAKGPSAKTAAKKPASKKKIVKKSSDKKTVSKKSSAKENKKASPKVTNEIQDASPVKKAKKILPKDKKTSIKKEAPSVEKAPPPKEEKLTPPSPSDSLSGSEKGIDSKPQDIEVKTTERDSSLRSDEAIQTLECELPTTLKDLSIKMQLKVSDLIKDLMGFGIMATINQNLSQDIVEKLCEKYNYILQLPKSMEEELLEHHDDLKESKQSKHRAPVITMMGHVDHGKTSLLDYIRKTRVVQKEKGGITQHIGAYQVALSNGLVTFLDTPGHAAFTHMRARGAQITDAVVLVVAADDGIMPQTREAVDHAKAAGVPIVVAINKCDLASADIDKVYQGLSELDLTPEEWGGKTVTVKVSAKTGEGVDDLLELLLLEAELLELKANPHAHAKGVVLESRLSKGRGSLATVIVTNGTLKQGDVIFCGLYWGRVKGMVSHTGEVTNQAGPSVPVEITGLSGVPEAGEEFFVVKDEKKAKTLSEIKIQKLKKEALGQSGGLTLESFYEKMQEEGQEELKVVLKGDVQGSLEALENSLAKVGSGNVRINVIHKAVGAITESDVMLARASNAIAVGFNVKMIPGVDAIAEREKVEVKLYSIIYEVVNDLQAALEGLLAPELKDVLIGKAEVRAIFQLSKSQGMIAGCHVVKGKILRNSEAHLIREGELKYQDKIASLKRFKDDVKEVAEGYECGIKLAQHSDVKEGDVIEVYQVEKITRRLSDLKSKN